MGRKTRAPSEVGQERLREIKAFPHNREGMLSPQACCPLCISYFLDESKGITPLKHIKADFLKFHQRKQIKTDTERSSREGS